MKVYSRRIKYVVSLLKCDFRSVSIVIILLISISYSYYQFILVHKYPEYLGVICRQPTIEKYKNIGTQDAVEGFLGETNVARTLEVTLSDDMKFNPSLLEVKENETIHFVVKNIGKIEHEMVLGSISELISHEREMLSSADNHHKHIGMVHLRPGETGRFSWKFSRVGEVSFACLQAGHNNAGMKGVVLVRSHSDV